MAKKLITQAFVCIGAIALALYVSREPWKHLDIQRRQTQQARAEMQRSLERQVHLTEEMARLETATGKESSARSQGYLRTGERRLKLEDE